MPVPVLSATECVTPAFRHTVQQMFRPIRFPFWLRMAVLGLFTGELAGGGFGGNFPTHWPSTPGAGGQAGTHPNIPWHHPGWFTQAHIVEALIALGIVFLLVMLVFLYISSVLRFVLFDAVLQGDTRIIAGWKRRRPEGRRYFVWQLLVTLIAWGLLILCFGVPLMMLFGGHHIGFWHIDATAIVVLVLTFFVWMLLALAIAIVAVLAKDFVVPMMALEGIGWQEGWRGFLRVAKGHASEYVIYLLMKIVLRIGAGIAHGILMAIVVVILLVPAVVLLLGGIAAGVGATVVVKALLITIGIVIGMVLLAFLIALSAIAGAPIAFYFPAYAIYFFAGRYEPLGRIVFPAPPVAPPPLEPPPLPV